MRKEQKVKEMVALTERIEKAKAMIFTEYRGLKVSEMNDLRSKLRAGKSTLKVVKNRLIKRVLEERGLGVLAKYFSGPTAVASSDVDPITPAKVLVGFAKEHDRMVLKGGYLEGRALTGADIKSLASMPSREELLARVLSSMNAPASNLVGVLAAIPRKLVYALNAIKNTKQQ